MRKITLQNRVTTGHLTLPVVTLICTTCWLLICFAAPTFTGDGNSYHFEQKLGLTELPQPVAQTVGFLIYAMMGYFLIEMNNAFGIIRIRASVQTSLFFLLITACPALYPVFPGSIAAFTLLISLYFLFKSYQAFRPASNLFHSFIFIGIGSLAFPQLTLLTPLWLLGAYNFQALTPRSFIAAVVGWSLPYWFLLGFAYYSGQMELFYAPFMELTIDQPMESGWLLHNQKELLTCSYLFIQYVVSASHIIASSHQDKIRARGYLYFINLICLLLFLFLLLLPQHSKTLLMMLFPLVSVLMGHLYVLTNNRASNLFFICSAIGLIYLFIYNVWML